MNPFSAIGRGIADAAKFVAHAVALVMGTAKRVEYVLAQGQPLEKPFVSALSTVVYDVEDLLAEAESAVTADGLNFAADSAAYQRFLKMINDFKALAPLAEDAIAVIEDKPEPFPQAVASLPLAQPSEIAPGLHATVAP
jgi:hypothetical protein